MKIHPIHYSLAALILTANSAYAGFRNFQEADLVLGRTAGAIPKMREVTAVVVDPVSLKVFVCDSGNSRVLRFGTVSSLTTGSAAEAVPGQTTLFTTFPRNGADGMAHPRDLAVDGSGTLWVADEHRVLRFDQAATKPSGAPADGVLGQADFNAASIGVSNSVMLSPSGLAVSGTTLYVSDQEANRVLRFDDAAAKPNGASAQAVFGQSSFTAISPDVKANRLNQPQGLAVDPSGTQTLWVADQSNHRVLAFANAGTATVNPNPARVLGQTSFTTKTSGTSAGKVFNPNGIAFAGGVLHVGDQGNFRALRWNTPYAGANGLDANGVFGQADFVTNVFPAGSSFFARKLSVDLTGALWAADHGEKSLGKPARALRYNSAASKPPGAPADLILTQPAAAAIGQLEAKALAISPVSRKLFVCDGARVLRYASATGLTTGSPPEAVLGQVDFTATALGAGASQMKLPLGLICSVNDELWVADTGNNRVLRFTNTSSRPNGAPADHVLGQAGFGLSASGVTKVGMNGPIGLALDDSATLWVADTGNIRVLRYNIASIKPNGGEADAVLGQFSFLSPTPGLSDKFMSEPTALCWAPGGQLWVLDAGNNRVLRFDNAVNKPTYAAANGVPGQPDFVTNAAGFASNRIDVSGDIPSTSGALAVDSVGRLYVGDSRNGRVMWFNAAAAKPNGAPANGLLGQPSFAEQDYSMDLRDLGGVDGLAFDSKGALWVADYSDSRVTRSSPILPAITGAGLDSGKHFTMTMAINQGGSYQIERSADLKTGAPCGGVISPLSTSHIWTNPLVAGLQNFFRVREVIP